MYCALYIDFLNFVTIVSTCVIVTGNPVVLDALVIVLLVNIYDLANSRTCDRGRNPGSGGSMCI